MVTSDFLSASRENGFCKFVPVLSPTSRNLSEWLDHDIPGSSHDSKLLSSEAHVWLRRELGLRNFIQEGSEPSSRKKVPHQDQHKLNAKSSFFLRKIESTQETARERETARTRDRESETVRAREQEGVEAGKRDRNSSEGGIPPAEEGKRLDGEGGTDWANFRFAFWSRLITFPPCAFIISPPPLPSVSKSQKLVHTQRTALYASGFPAQRRSSVCKTTDLMQDI